MMDDETRALLTTARDWALQAQGEKGWNEYRDNFIKRIEFALDNDGVREVQEALIDAVGEHDVMPGYPVIGDVVTSIGTMPFRHAVKLLAPFVAKRLQPKGERR